MAEAVNPVFRRPVPFIRRKRLSVPTGLTLIVCCAGFGKTACLCQLAEEYPQSVCLSLCESDDCGCVSALLGESLPEAEIEPADSARIAVRKAIGAMQKRDRCLLLIDNADAVSCDVLRLLAEAAVNGEIDAVFAARQLPAYLLTCVMDGSAALWGADELRFTAEETAALAAVLNPRLTDGELSRLHTFSGGWRVAVCELLRRFGTDVYDAADRSYLSEYIEGNILSGLSGDLRERFLQFAFLQGDEAFYRDGLRLPDMHAALYRLSRMGIVSRQGEDFSCPDVMRRLLGRLLPEEQRTGLTEQAADYYIRSQRFAEAIRLFEVSGNSAYAFFILCLCTFCLFPRSRFFCLRHSCFIRVSIKLLPYCFI